MECFLNAYLLLLWLLRLIESCVGLSRLVIGLTFIAQEVINIAACYYDIVCVLQQQKRLGTRWENFGWE
jgi:hypothetical protein